MFIALPTMFAIVFVTTRGARRCFSNLALRALTVIMVPAAAEDGMQHHHDEHGGGGQSGHDKSGGRNSREHQNDAEQHRNGQCRIPSRDLAIFRKCRAVNDRQRSLGDLQPNGTVTPLTNLLPGNHDLFPLRDNCHPFDDEGSLMRQHRCCMHMVATHPALRGQE